MLAYIFHSRVTRARGLPPSFSLFLTLVTAAVVAFGVSNDVTRVFLVIDTFFLLLGSSPQPRVTRPTTVSEKIAEPPRERDLSRAALAKISTSIARFFRFGQPRAVKNRFPLRLPRLLLLLTQNCNYTRKKKYPRHSRCSTRPENGPKTVGPRINTSRSLRCGTRTEPYF